MAKLKFGINAQFTSTGLGLSIIGEHCYAYNVKGASTTEADQLNFTTGSYYILGKLYCNGSVEDGPAGSGDISVWKISFNGLEVARLKTDSAQEDMPMNAWNKILIPPYTKFVVTCDSGSNASDRPTSTVFTGRIYNA